MLSSACATTPEPAPRYCPVPSEVELDEIREVALSGAYPNATRWLGRVVSWCWPVEADEARRGS